MLKRLIETINDEAQKDFENEALETEELDDEDATLESESPEKAKFTGRRTNLYKELESLGFSGESLFSLQDSLEEITKKAQILAEKIQGFKNEAGITTDLSGEFLAEELRNSIIRLKVYFWFTFGIYQEKIQSTNTIDAYTTSGALHNPNSKQLKILHAIFLSLTEQEKQIIFSKSDFITRQLKKAVENANSKISESINILLKEAQNPLNLESQPIDANVNDLAISLLYTNAFKQLVKAYTTASTQSLPKIDEKIFSYFSSPIRINEKIRMAKASASGYTDFTIDLETGKRVPKLNPKNMRITSEPTVGSEGAEKNDLDILPTTLEKPSLFSEDKAFIHYFKNTNYISIVADLLNRYSKKPESKIVFYDHATSSMKTESFWNLLHNNSIDYSENSVIPISVLAMNILSGSVEYLVTLAGDPTPITPEIKHSIGQVLKQQAIENKLYWFDISKLPGLNKEYIRKYLHADNLPNFEISTKTTLSSNVFKERALEYLHNLKIKTQDLGTQQLIDTISSTIKQLEDTDLIKIELGKILKGRELDSLYRSSLLASSEPKPDDGSKLLSKKISDSLINTFAIVDQATFDKMFAIGQTSYNNKQLPSVIYKMTASELESLWNSILSGQIKTKLGLPFSSLSSTGPGSKVVASLTDSMNSLIQLKKSLTESILIEAAVENASDILQDIYIDFFTSEAIPIIQAALVDIKKIGPFLISFINKFKKYGKYLTFIKTNESELAVDSNPNMSIKELDEIDELQSYFISGPNKSQFAAHQLISALHNSTVPGEIIDRLTTIFLDYKEDSSFTSQLLDPAMLYAYPKMKTWILNSFDKKGTYGFRKAFEEAEASGSLDPVKELLHKYKEQIEFLLGGGKLGKEPGAILKIIKSITYGLYSGYAKSENMKKGEPAVASSPIKLGFFNNS